jgi:glycosyltransferase involved in cell wall biosynthesis
MPAYNEQRTIAQAIAGVLRTTYPCDFELIVVDDGSTDGTAEILRALDHPHAGVITHKSNYGKGAALQTGALAATGTHLVPFDADLEYDPADLPAMVRPVLHGRTEVVYGARLFGQNTRYQSYRHAVGNRALTLAANVMFDAYLSDIHTCLKLVPVDLFRDIELAEDRFGLDSEITAKLLARGIKPFEVPVSYHSRSVEHGKKINWRDGIECLRVLARVRTGRMTSSAGRASDDPLEALAIATTVLAELASYQPSTSSEFPDVPEFPGTGVSGRAGSAG